MPAAGLSARAIAAMARASARAAELPGSMPAWERQPWLTSALGAREHRRDLGREVAALHPLLSWVVLTSAGDFMDIIRDTPRRLDVIEAPGGAALCSGVAAEPLDQAFSRDASHLLVVEARGGRLLRQRISFPERDRPLWLLDLGVVLTGHGLSDDGRLAPVPDYAARRQRFVADVRRAAAGGDSRARFVLSHLAE